MVGSTSASSCPVTGSRPIRASSPIGLIGRFPGQPDPWMSAPITDGYRAAGTLEHRPRRVAGPGFLLVGDAAGFIDPLSGEGLHRALVSSDTGGGCHPALAGRRPTRDGGLRSPPAIQIPDQGCRVLGAPGVHRPASAARLRTAPPVAPGAREEDAYAGVDRPAASVARARPSIPAQASRSMNATRVAAYALVRDGEQRILLVRIAPGYPASGQWTLPGGGVNFGEDPVATVVRELAEETGLDGRVERLAFVQSGSGPRDDGSAWHAIRIVYEVAIVGGELRDEVDESTDLAAWFTSRRRTCAAARRPGSRRPSITAPVRVRTEISIDVAAPPRAVFDLACRIERWPDLLPHYRYVTVRSLTDGRRDCADVCAQDVRAGRIARRVAQRIPLRRCGSATSFASTSCTAPASTRGMRVTWRIRPRRGRESGDDRARFQALAAAARATRRSRDRRSSVRQANRRPDAGHVQATGRGAREAPTTGRCG